MKLWAQRSCNNGLSNLGPGDSHVVFHLPSQVLLFYPDGKRSSTEGPLGNGGDVAPGLVAAAPLGAGAAIGVVAGFVRPGGHDDLEQGVLAGPGGVAVAGVVGGDGGPRGGDPHPPPHGMPVGHAGALLAAQHGGGVGVGLGGGHGHGHGHGAEGHGGGGHGGPHGGLGPPLMAQMAQMHRGARRDTTVSGREVGMVRRVAWARGSTCTWAIVSYLGWLGGLRRLLASRCSSSTCQ